MKPTLLFASLVVAFTLSLGTDAVNGQTNVVAEKQPKIEGSDKLQTAQRDLSFEQGNAERHSYLRAPHRIANSRYH